MDQEPDKPQRSVSEQVARGLIYTAIILAVVCGFGYLLLAPVFRSAKVAAQFAAEQDAVRQVDLALIRYSAGSHDHYPDFSGDMPSVLRPYISDPKVLKAMTHFVFNEKLSNRSINDIEDPEAMWILYSHESPSSKFVVGFADGHVKRISPHMIDDILRQGNRIEPEKRTVAKSN